MIVLTDIYRLTVVFSAEIEETVRNIQASKQKLLSRDSEEDRVGLGAEGHYDKDIYGGSRYDGGYFTSIAPDDEPDVSYIFSACSEPYVSSVFPVYENNLQVLEIVR